MAVAAVHITIIVIIRHALIIIHLLVVGLIGQPHLYRFQGFQLWSKFLFQQLSCQQRMILVCDEFVYVLGCKHRLLIERNPVLAVSIEQLHVYPSTDRLHLSILLEHVLLVRACSANRIAHGKISITTIDDVIIVAYIQISTCTIFPVLGIIYFTKVNNRCNGITYITRCIDQIATTFIKDDVTLCYVLQRLEYAPIGIQGILCHGVCVTLTVGREHVLT